MSYQKLLNKELINCSGFLADDSLFSEVLCMFEFIEVEIKSPIESELNAIERMENLRSYHEELGIKKDSDYYNEFKQHTLRLNDKGLKREIKHLFKDEFGFTCKIWHN